jgi:VanZ family protein
LGRRFDRCRPWIPVFIWLGVLALESSDLGSSADTGSVLRWIWTKLFGEPNPDAFDLVHHYLRKTGHFAGYAILSWLIFRALRGTWRNRQQIAVRSREYFWQLRWALLGIAGTLAAGSLDEFHQSFDPNRTSRWQDVVIDTSGALLLQFLMYLVLSLWHRRTDTSQSAQALSPEI